MEQNPPLASSIDFQYDMEVLSLRFENVPVNQLDAIKPAYFKLMQDVSKKSLDLERIHNIIKRGLASHISQVESNPKSLYVMVGFLQVLKLPDLGTQFSCTNCWKFQLDL